MKCWGLHWNLAQCFTDESIFRTHFEDELQGNIALSVLVIPIANNYACAMIKMVLKVFKMERFGGIMKSKQKC